MNKRKLFLFNPVNYRIKKIFLLISVILICNLCIIYSSFYFISIKQTFNTKNTAELQKAVDTDNNIIKSFLILSQKTDSGKYSLAADKITADHQASYDTATNYIKSISEQNKNITDMFKIFIAIITVLTLITFLFIIMIFSKIVGPAFYINRLIEKHLEGETVDTHDLRNGDEFEDLYGNVKKLIAKSKGKA
ncbi:MAG: hypothetical protein JW982_08075 [Spirochaetes bacterium]|nr:hypothetical protein [Spirochaetota bacterium]